MSQRKKIIIISQKYPFGSGENYMERELDFFAKEYDEILLFPLHIYNNQRSVNSKTKVFRFFENKAISTNNRLIIKYFRLIFSVLWIEFRHTEVKPYFIKSIKSTLVRLLLTLKDMETFEKELEKLSALDADFYSVWMEEGALLMALLKKRKRIKNFSFRLHGYDLYDDRREGNYMPFRYFCFQQVKNIFIVSKAGKQYLEGKKLFPSKLITNYSGLYDYGLNPKIAQNDVFVICSCSNIIPLKRVHKIAEALLDIPFKTHWIHIGDGSELERIKSITDKFPAHITADLTGLLDSHAVRELYAEVPIDIFIHVSETEGLPLSIVEAMSAGIPVIATDAGGTNEIVNSDNGELLAVNFQVSELREKIIELRSNESYWLEKKEGARKLYLDYFNAEKNYSDFVKKFRS